MNKTILFSFLLGSVISFAQDNHQRVKAELVEWDAVRGEWLAESFNAMANDQPIPDRTFPEDITPAEMYALVPSDRRERNHSHALDCDRQWCRKGGSPA